MAIIKIKNIKSNLQAVINYGKNGDKTENGISLIYFLFTKFST